jgi:hypothetical protein
VASQHLVANRILRQLSPDELNSIEPWLSPIRLEPNVVLLAPGGEIEQVYFPLSGMVSLLSVMHSGEAIETGIVGADGVVGGDAPYQRARFWADDGPNSRRRCQVTEGAVRGRLSRASAAAETWSIAISRCCWRKHSRMPPATRSIPFVAAYADGCCNPRT